jgi:GNAT superfamily N-acetyltransferase
VTAPQIRRVRHLPGRRVFVDVPFRIHGGDPGWVPPLRLTVYDRLSPRHPAASHQETALWVAYRDGRPVGRIGACVDSFFNEYQGEKWGWVGFFDSFDDVDVAHSLFDAACGWIRDRGMERAMGPASFTTNDELGLMVEGFGERPFLMTTQNPPYYERLWTSYGWEQAMDLLGWYFNRWKSAHLSERQQRALDRIRSRSGLRIRSVNMDDWDNEISRFFEVYNAAWSRNWGFAPMPEAEVRHLGRQLKSVINPEWAFGAETPSGEAVGVCLALPDLNQPMARVRSGRLLPFGWYPLVTAKKTVTQVRIWALGVKPSHQNLAVGALLYAEIVDRLKNEPNVLVGEASWTLASNDRMNSQIEALGGELSRRWRLYQRAL